MSSKIIVKGYQIGRKIDQIGLRTIYQGLEIRTGKEVFITVISVRPGRSMDILTKRAIQSKKIYMPRLVTAISHGLTLDGQFYYVHQATPSFPITQVLSEIPNENERLFTQIRFFVELLETVDYLHEAGTTHRDLSTIQVRIDQKFHVLLEGFVNARPRLEARNVLNVVNLPYISPEQLSGSPADVKTDVYSLGVIFFELITGVLPYRSNFAKTEDMREGVVPSPSMHKMDVPPEIEAMTLKALAPRASRYANCHEWIRDLETFYKKRSMRMKIKDLKLSFQNIFSFRP